MPFMEHLLAIVELPPLFSEELGVVSEDQNVMTVSGYISHLACGLCDAIATLKPEEFGNDGPRQWWLVWDSALDLQTHWEIQI